MGKTYEDARAKLIADSTDRDWYDLWPSVTSARTELLRALESVTEETAARRPGEGEGEAAWSITDVVRHALLYTRNLRAIVEETSRGRPAIKDRGAFSLTPAWPRSLICGGSSSPSR